MTLLERLKKARPSTLDRSNPRAPVPMSLVPLSEEERELLITLLGAYHESKANPDDRVNPTGG